MTDTPSPFAPFLPGTPATQTELPAAEKPARKKRTPKTEEVVTGVAEQPNGDLKIVTKRQPRKASLKTQAPKFDLQTTLAAASTLNEADFPLFEKLVILLDEAGKPARDRVLEAVGKIFS
jgi:hypothetical protein